MATLEKIMQMQNQGMSEPQIIQNLKQQGIPPKEIEESLSQSKIKSALNTNPNQGQANQSSMQQSIMSQENPADSQGIPQPQTPMMPPQPPNTSSQPQSAQTPQFVQTSQPQFFQVPFQVQTSEIPYPSTQGQNTKNIPPQSLEIPTPPGEYPIPEQELPSEDYTGEEQYPEYEPQQTIDIEAINELSEQIVDEKTMKLKKQVSSLVKFQEKTETEIKKINERLQRIEDNFGNLQTAVLKKIGDYTRDMEDLSKEMHMTQESFSKILNPVIDKKREKEGFEDSEENRDIKKSRKNQPNFEDYLR